MRRLTFVVMVCALLAAACKKDVTPDETLAQMQSACAPAPDAWGAALAWIETPTPAPSDELAQLLDGWGEAQIARLWRVEGAWHVMVAASASPKASERTILLIVVQAGELARVESAQVSDGSALWPDL